ncbi:MAG TPA: hypothetical protein VF841_10865 [Anaeromyxobacter sp.]
MTGRTAREGRRAALRATVAVLLAAAAGRAHADSWALRLEGDYLANEGTVVDASGVSTRTRTQALRDDYRLAVSKDLYESLVFSGDGWLQDTHAWAGGVTTTTRSWAGALRLDFGGEVLRGGVTYDRRQTRAGSSQPADATGAVSVASASPTLVYEALGATLNWRPIELAPVSLRLLRSEQYDLERTLRDVRTSSVSLQTQLGTAGALEGSALLGWSELDDRLRGSSIGSWSGQGAVRYGGKFLRDGTYYLNDGLTASVTDTRANGPNAVVATQQFAVAGLALIEAIPATPTQSTLKPLPALVDGDVATAAGVNLGTSAPARGDAANRHLGLQFPDVLRPVNTLYVWVSQPLPPEIVAQFTWTAYRSDDNVTWTPVPLAGPVVFGTFEARFELTIPVTQARYLKVVTTPLPVGATVDPRFADIQVTELQAFDIVPAESVRGSMTAWSNSFSGVLSLPLTASRQLRYDLSLTLGTRGTGGTIGNAWLVANGLGWARPLSPTLSATARLQRADSGATGSGHLAQTTWAAMLAAQPLQTLNGTLGYSGSLTEAPGSRAVSNGVTGLVTANLYEGVDATASAGATAGSFGDRRSYGTQATVSTVVTPASAVSFTGSYGVALATASGGAVAPSRTLSETLSGSATWTPVPALLLSGTLTRLRVSREPARSLGSFQIGYSPLRGGSLIISLNHSEAFESQSQSSSRSSTASLTWRLTPWARLVSTYGVASASAPLGRSDAQSFTAQLVLTL